MVSSELWIYCDLSTHHLTIELSTLYFHPRSTPWAERPSILTDRSKALDILISYSSGRVFVAFVGSLLVASPFRREDRELLRQYNDITSEQ